MKKKLLSSLKKAFFALLAGFLFSLPVCAQNITVKGHVKDAKTGEEIIGASIAAKGTTIGTVSDIDGNFTLSAPQGSTISVTFLGYRTKEFQATTNPVTVALEEDAILLNEVVAIGYGTQTKKELTGSISSIKAEDFNRGVSANPLGLVQGKVAGLTIIKNGGDDPAQNSYQVQLRGLGSLKGNGVPLYVIDGVAGGDLNTVPQEDIESIDVLKDGSAAAIYGTRANHGVILITTKRGKEGGKESRTSIEYSGDFGMGVIAKRPRMLNASEYRQYMVANGLGVDYGGNTNWIDEIVRPSATTTHSLSMTSGTKDFNYRATIGYKNATGLIIGSDYSQINGKIAADQKAFNSKLLVQYDLNYIANKKNWVDYDVLDRAVQANPTLPVRFTEDNPKYEKYNGWYEIEEFGTYNPVSRIKESQNLQKTSTFLGNVRATLSLTDNWKIGTSYSLQNYNSWNGKYYSRYRKGDYILGLGKAEQEYDYTQMQIIESIIQYTNSWGKHNFQAIAGHSYSTSELQGFYAKNNDFPVDFMAYNSLQMGKGLQTGETSNVEVKSYRYIDKLAAFFARAIYNYNQKYYLNASVRMEGSSRFGPKASPNFGRYGLFPAISGSWRITEEDFLKDDAVLNDLKLRAGFGVTGNQPYDEEKYKNHSHYTYLMRVGKSDSEVYLDDKWVSPWGPQSNENQYLRWEKKQEYNVGVDFILINRLSGSIDTYLRNITDLLWEYHVPSPPYPFGEKWDNYGQLRNMGIELSLNYEIIKKKELNWSVGLVMAKNANKVIKITGGEYANNNAGYLPVGDVSGRGLTGVQVMRLEEGKPIGNFYGYKFYDIRSDGKMRFYTKEGGITSEPSSADVQVIGNAQPWATFGFNTAITYKQWDAVLNFRGQIGGTIFNEMRFIYENTAGAENVLLSAVDPSAAIAPDREASKIKDQRKFSDFYLENATFIKLGDVSVGYNFGLSDNVKKYMSSLRLSLTAQNLLTITGYSGMDPEVSMEGLTPGIDRKSYYPHQKTVLFGLRATF